MWRFWTLWGIGPRSISNELVQSPKIRFPVVNSYSMKCWKQGVDSINRWEVIAIQTRCIFITFYNISVGQFSRKLSHVYKSIHKGQTWISCNFPYTLNMKYIHQNQSSDGICCILHLCKAFLYKLTEVRHTVYTCISNEWTRLKCC